MGRSVTGKYTPRRTPKPVGVTPRQFDSDLRHHLLITKTSPPGSPTPNSGGGGVPVCNTVMSW